MIVNRAGIVVEIKTADNLRDGDFLKSEGYDGVRYFGKITRENNRHGFYGFRASNETVIEILARDIRVEGESLHMGDVVEKEINRDDKLYKIALRVYLGTGQNE